MSNSKIHNYNNISESINKDNLPNKISSYNNIKDNSSNNNSLNSQNQYNNNNNNNNNNNYNNNSSNLTDINNFSYDINQKSKKSDLLLSCNNRNSLLRDKISITLPIILNHIINNNVKLNISCDLDLYSTPFDINNPEKVPLDSYIKKVIDLSQAENSTIIYSLCLIDVLCTSKGFIITRKNVHKLFFIALMISIKLIEDKIFCDKDYSLVSGINLFEMIQLESVFIVSLDYKIVINENSFYNYFLTFSNQ